jgi:hypothetical protein
MTDRKMHFAVNREDGWDSLQLDNISEVAVCARDSDVARYTHSTGV